jgi:VIT1/CCC1 family predicted Fe2+/Mn2+ transporter
MKLDFHEDYIRSAFFGLQDGLVSTTGVVVGISAGVQDRSIVILASLVAVTVEASSMAAGQYSSEKAVHQMDKTGKHTDSLIIGALIMFFAYLGAGMIPIVPVILIGPPVSSILGVIFALIGLFTIGYVRGMISREKPLRDAVELLIIGGTATGIGLLVGYLLKV